MNSYDLPPLGVPVLEVAAGSQTSASNPAASVSTFSVAIQISRPVLTKDDDMAVAACLPSLKAAVDFLKRIG